MKYFIYIALIFSALLFTQCKQTPITSNNLIVLMPNQKFVEQSGTIDARSGGPDFLILKEKQEADYKHGDIVELGTYKVEKGKLTYFSNFSDFSKTWTIKDKATLVDEYNKEWLSK